MYDVLTHIQQICTSFSARSPDVVGKNKDAAADGSFCSHPVNSIVSLNWCSYELLHSAITSSALLYTYRFRHPNIVPLMGYCPQPPALVYPFMARQSLFRNLHQWKVCYQYYVIPQVYHEVQMPKSVNTFIILAGGQPTNLETENLCTSGFCPWDFLPPFGDTSGCAP